MDREHEDLAVEVASLRSAVVGFKATMERLETALTECLRALQDGRVKFVENDAALRALVVRVDALEAARKERTTDLKAILFPVVTQLLLTVGAVIATYVIAKGAP